MTKGGYIHLWQETYGVICGQVLHILQKKRGKVLYRIHLEVASIKHFPDDPKVLIVHNGTNDVPMQAKTIKEANDWFTAIEKAQNALVTFKQKQETMRSSDESDGSSNASDVLNKSISQIWCCQANLDEALSTLELKVPNQNSPIQQIVRSINSIGHELKVNPRSSSFSLEWR